jgi:uncharacterized protein YjbJ (UPF0337 family)
MTGISVASLPPQTAPAQTAPAQRLGADGSGADGSARTVISQHEERGNQMNRDIVGGKWQQVRGKVKEEWGKLTDDDLKVAEGKFDKLAGLIRERYGYTREKAEEELERFCKKHHVYVEEEIKR